MIIFITLFAAFYYFVESIAVDSLISDSGANTVNIVYVYSIHKKFCQFGFPEYLAESINHTVNFQKHARVILGSNFQDCPSILTDTKWPVGLELLDIVKIASNRTRWYSDNALRIFPTDHQNELWTASAVRFFNLEDIMHKLGISEAFHLEGDNLLYGQVYQIFPILKAHYPLAGVPQSANRAVITASVFWISNMEALKQFTDYLVDLLIQKIIYDEKLSTNTNSTITAQQRPTVMLELSYKENVLDQYVQWLRKFACCKQGGLFPDSSGRGIRPFGVNEMSMLGHYQHLFPERLINLPVIPHHPKMPRRRPFSDVSVYARGGNRVGTWHNDWIWDGASWGQYMGGTHIKKGANKKFIDPGHIQGQSIIQADCIPRLVCDSILHDVTHHPGCKNLTVADQKLAYENTLRQYYGFSSPDRCFLVPMVSCNNVEDSTKLSPIFNLHVHSKIVSQFLSTPCACNISTPEQIPQECKRKY